MTAGDGMILLPGDDVAVYHQVLDSLHSVQFAISDVRVANTSTGPAYWLLEEETTPSNLPDGPPDTTFIWRYVTLGIEDSSVFGFSRVINVVRQSFAQTVDVFENAYLPTRLFARLGYVLPQVL